MEELPSEYEILLLAYGAAPPEVRDFRVLWADSYGLCVEWWAEGRRHEAKLARLEDGLKILWHWSGN